jgi:hypothetical protein
MQGLVNWILIFCRIFYHGPILLSVVSRRLLGDPGDISRWMRELMQGNVLSEEALNIMKDVHVISSESLMAPDL